MVASFRQLGVRGERASDGRQCFGIAHSLVTGIGLGQLIHFGIALALGAAFEGLDTSVGKLAKAHMRLAACDQVLQPLHRGVLGGCGTFRKLHRLGICQGFQRGHGHGFVLGQQTTGFDLAFSKAHKACGAIAFGFFCKRGGLRLCSSSLFFCGFGFGIGLDTCLLLGCKLFLQGLDFCFGHG